MRTHIKEGAFQSFVQVVFEIWIERFFFRQQPMNPREEDMQVIPGINNNNVMGARINEEVDGDEDQNPVE